MVLGLGVWGLGILGFRGFRFRGFGLRVHQTGFVCRLLIGDMSKTNADVFTHACVSHRHMRV